MGLSIFGTNRVFISHSSRDTDIISAVERAFDGLESKPYFVEREITGSPPTKKIAELVGESDALFVFLTSNSLSGETRDWIIFELGVALAKGKKIHAWKERQQTEVIVPRLLEQITTYREFEPTVQGMFKLTDEVKKAAKKLYSLF